MFFFVPELPDCMFSWNRSPLLQDPTRPHQTVERTFVCGGWHRLTCSFVMLKKCPTSVQQGFEDATSLSSKHRRHLPSLAPFLPQGSLRFSRSRVVLESLFVLAVGQMSPGAGVFLPLDATTNAFKAILGTLRFVDECRDSTRGKVVAIAPAVMAFLREAGGAAAQHGHTAWRDSHFPPSPAEAARAALQSLHAPAPAAFAGPPALTQQQRDRIAFNRERAL